MTEQPEPDPDEEPPLSETEKAYNVASYDLFQLAAYGHYRYNPLTDRSTGRYLDITQIQADSRAYNDRLRAAQEQFEAAVLLKAAEQLEAKGGPTCSPGDCCWFDAVAELRRLAAPTP